MTWKEFADKHGACPEGYKWAEESGCTTMDEVWARHDFPVEFRIWCATRPGVLTDRELRLFAVWCARQVQHLMTDSRSIAALDVAERYANGQATDDELAAARAAAWNAGAAAWNAGAAARSAAQAAARAAAWNAGAAARDAARAAAWAAAWNAGAAARDAQVQYLIDNTNPIWDGVRT
jgi:hypothetical protein